MSLAEITMRNLQSNGDIDLRDFLQRVDMLAACGMTVLISDYFEYYRLAAYLTRYTKKKIGITMGAGSLHDLFDEKYYTELDGGILESFGRMFKNDLKLYIYPLLDRTSGELTTVDNLEIAPEIRKLYQYLVDKGCIEQLDNYNPEYLSTFSREVLRQIEAGEPRWTDHVPPEVAEVILRAGLLWLLAYNSNNETTIAPISDTPVCSRLRPCGHNDATGEIPSNSTVFLIGAKFDPFRDKPTGLNAQINTLGRSPPEGPIWAVSFPSKNPRFIEPPLRVVMGLRRKINKPMLLRRKFKETLLQNIRCTSSRSY